MSLRLFLSDHETAVARRSTFYLKYPFESLSVLTDQTDVIRFVNRTIFRGVGLLNFGPRVKMTDRDRQEDRPGGSHVQNNVGWYPGPL